MFLSKDLEPDTTNENMPCLFSGGCVTSLNMFSSSSFKFHNFILEFYCTMHHTVFTHAPADDTQVGSASWLLWLAQQWGWLSKGSGVASPLGNTPRSGIAGPYGTLLLAHWASFTCISRVPGLASDPANVEGALFPHHLPHSSLVVFLITAIPAGVRWNVVLICIFLIAMFIEHY